MPWPLKDALKGLDCFVVRAPVSAARTLMRSDIEYSLFLFDGGPAGAELEAYARTLRHRVHTPAVLVKKAGDVESLVKTLTRLLRG